LRPVPEDEWPGDELELVFLRQKPSGLVPLADAVAEAPQLLLDLGLPQARAGVQLDRPGVDAGGQGEAPALELAGDPQVEVEGESEERGGAGEQRIAEIP